ncbi:cytochrome P450 monooxygenase [Diaporthe helianthi]|uniref:Cytochrome P450 monooxygenase n=1 Tax=Diaporthe helianthi TaxID=158607 RepID=A0A2P5HK44_DIAHE|nr:cytochrome P450 monooxygenase [Diaporthe helianthi]
MDVVSNATSPYRLEGISSPWVVSRLALQLCVLAIFSVCVKRLYFHPLSKYPGPWYHAVSDVPFVVSLLSGRQFAYNKKLHDKYGPVVRLAPNELSFITPQAMEDIFGYGTKKGMAPTEKDPRFSLATKMKPPHGLITAPKDDHARLRRGLAAVFTTSALIQQEVIVQSHVDELVAAFSGACVGAKDGTAVVDMQLWGNFLAFDVIGSLTFGKPFGCLKSGGGEHLEFARSLRHIITMGPYEQAASRLVGLNSPLQPLVCKLLADKTVYENRLKSYGRTFHAIQQRVAAGVKEDHKDFMYHILKNNENRHLLSEGEIHTNLAGFIIAGGETVGLTLTLWAYCMGTNRDAYHKLRDLIRGTFASAEDIRWTALKDMDYLNAVIRETFRLPLFGTVQRLRVVPPGGMPVDGHVLPGGTSVAIAEYAATHHPDNFKDPHEFRPERWLNADPATMDALTLSRPFSYGPRDCIGKNLAGIEVRLAIAHIIWNFDLDIEPIENGGPNWAWDKEGDWRHVRAVAGPIFSPLYMKLTKVVR